MTQLRELRLPMISANMSQYGKLAPSIYHSLKILANKLRGRTIIHINSAADGGGVAELLKSQVSIEQSLGLNSRWFVIHAPLEFFTVTKKIHNLMQGRSGGLTKREKTIYFKTNEALAVSMRKFLLPFSSGIVIIHDPQPLPLIKDIPRQFTPILRLHLDMTAPNRAALNFLKPYINKYQRIILSNPAYKKAMPWYPAKRQLVVAPAIDPLSQKNKHLSAKKAADILKRFNIDTAKPIAAQVSRFDPWKDPLGVVEAFRLARKDVPDLQLIMAGFFQAADDPEAIKVFQKVCDHAEKDPNIHLFANLSVLNDIPMNLFINAVFTASEVVVQKSVREGFGLSVAEAMWKERAVVAGKTTGTKMQIQNMKNGLLVSSPKETAKAIVQLLNNKKLRGRLGKNARLSVKKNFLLPKYLLSHFQIYYSILNTQ